MTLLEMKLRMPDWGSDLAPARFHRSAAASYSPHFSNNIGSSSFNVSNVAYFNNQLRRLRVIGTFSNHLSYTRVASEFSDQINNWKSLQSNNTWLNHSSTDKIHFGVVG